MSRAPAGESTVPPHGSQAPFKRRVVLRIGPLPEGIPDLPYQDGAEAFLIKHQLLSEWAAIEGDFPGVTLRRVFFTLTPEQIVELQTRALRMRPGSINDLRRYFFVETPEKRSPNLLLDRIRALPIVAEAYLESPQRLLQAPLRRVPPSLRKAISMPRQEASGPVPSGRPTPTPRART